MAASWQRRHDANGRVLCLPVTMLLFLVLVSLPTLVALLPYGSYGDELQEAHRFWNLTSSFNEAAYFSEHRRCYKLPGVWAPGSEKLEWCFGEVNGRFRSTAVLWQPAVASQPPLWLLRRNDSAEHLRHALLDCSYSVEPIVLRHAPREMAIEYVFGIAQGGCKHQVGQSGSGTTFEIFGFNALFLTNCVYEYGENGQARYHVRCRFPYSHFPSFFNDVASGNLAAEARCLNLTVIIDHENYDSFSEVQSDRFMPAEKFYISPRTVLTDNTQYCFPGIIGEARLAEKPQLQLPDHVVYYSAVWPSLRLSRVLYPNSKMAPLDSRNLTAESGRYQGYETHFGNGSFHTTIEYKEWTNTTSLRQIYHLASVAVAKDMASTVASISLRPSHELGETYNYDLIRVSALEGTVAVPRKFLQNVSFNTPTDKIHFIGASHVRYFYDAVHEMTFGPTVNDAWNRKHQSTSHNNLEFTYLRYTDDVADLLIQLCRSTAAAAGRKKVVIHPGPWDMSSGSLRLFIRDNNYLPNLLRAVQTILDGSQSCPSIETLVLVLQAPFPLCNDDSFFICNQWRYYRRNPAIAAANKHILNSLLHPKTKASSLSPRLAIVDMYSIIKPRLGFDEDAEIACAAHYVCRVTWNRDSATIWTLGGKAVFDAIMHALS